MLKYLSIIALTAACIVPVASAQSLEPSSFDFNYSNWSGKNVPYAPWYLPPSHFRNSNSYFYTVDSFAGETASMDVSVTWSGQNANADRATLASFTAAANTPSTVTFNFSEAVTDLSFVVYGLQVTNGSVGGKLKIQGIDGLDIEDNFMNADLTAASGYGEYQRITTWNKNGQEMVSVTVAATVTSLTLYFESQAYQISNILFNSVGGSPIPEPSTYAAILGLGVVAAVIIRRRKA